MIHLYIGEGKGKTSAAIGLAIRAAGAGKKIAFIQFDKGFGRGRKHYSERNILAKISNIDLFATGCERMNPDGTFRYGITAEDRKEAQKGLQISEKILRENKYDVIILDEILTSISTKLISEEDVDRIIDLHKKNPQNELILTGRCECEKLIEKADLVTEMKKIKHYFDKGTKARKGIEY